MRLLLRSIFSFCLFLNLCSIRAQEKTFKDKLTVAQDGSGDFKTIQEAVNSVRDLGPGQVSIFIKKGI